MKHYDLIVIGSGGAARVATSAAQLGKRVAVIEECALGGTCLNRGCIPSKMLIYPANVLTMIQDVQKFNMSIKVESVDFSKIVRRISKTVDHDSKQIEEAYKSKEIKNLELYNGHAEFLNDNTIRVTNKELTADLILIAVGARPEIPIINGLSEVPFMTSTEALRNTKIPNHLLIIGGGYIACELGHAYGALGSEVTLIVRSELLKNEDKDIRKEFSTHFQKRYKVQFGVSKRVEYKNKEFFVTIETIDKKEKVLSGDGLLIATGVKPNTDSLGLENTKIGVDKNGFIKVDRFMQTMALGVYAIGDCVGNYMFRHSVNYEADQVLKNLFIEKRKLPIRYPPIPHAIFTYPELASVGVTEDSLITEGKKKGEDYILGVSVYKKTGMGLARLSEVGTVKLIFEKKSQRLIGGHILGDEASTMIHQLIYAMTFKATIDDILSIVYIHPALPEVVRNAAREAKCQLST